MKRLRGGPTAAAASVIADLTWSIHEFERDGTPTKSTFLVNIVSHGINVIRCYDTPDDPGNLLLTASNIGCKKKSNGHVESLLSPLCQYVGMRLIRWTYRLKELRVRALK